MNSKQFIVVEREPAAPQIAQVEKETFVVVADIKRGLKGEQGTQGNPGRDGRDGTIENGAILDGGNF